MRLALVLLLAFLLLPPTVAAGPEEILLSLVNDYRAEHGLDPLLRSQRLTDAAGWMAEDMAQMSYFSHTDSLGRDCFDRMAAYGYTGALRGETLAKGSEEPAAILDAFVRSAGHNSVFLNGDFQVVGIGRSSSYWVLNFGACLDCPIYSQWRWT